MRSHLIRMAIAVSAASLISGCAALENSTANPSSTAEIGSGQVENTHKSQKTLRYEQKMQVGKALCTLQSNNHDKQSMLVTLPPQLILRDGNLVTLPEYYGTTVKNPMYAPFNMIGCIQEIKRSKWETVITRGIDAASDLLMLGAKGAIAYKVIGQFTDNTGLKLEGDNNRINAGDGDYTEQIEPFSGISITPIDGSTVGIVPPEAAAPEVEADAPVE